MHKHLRFGGFTVIELLLVMSIIGILCGLAFTGYVAYVNNVQKSKIANAVSAYQQALQGVTFEDDDVPVATFGACTSSSGYCCVPSSASQWLCGLNSADPTSQAAAAYDKIKKYIPTNTPSLPDITPASWAACSGSWAYNTVGPCNMNNITYWPAVPTSPTTSIPGLVYYVPSSYDCNSPNTLKYDSATFTWSKQDGTLFSRRVSGSAPFTECVVSLK